MVFYYVRMQWNHDIYCTFVARLGKLQYYYTEILYCSVICSRLESEHFFLYLLLQGMRTYSIKTLHYYHNEIQWYWDRSIYYSFCYWALKIVVLSH